MSDLPGDDEPTREADTLSRASAAASPGSHPPALEHYKIVRKLGQGGMGIVYEAEQENPHRRVALKVIRGGRFVDDLTVRMFQREADTLARLKHPGIAAIYESGTTDDGQYFFAMELVEGRTLGEHLAAAGAPRSAEDLRSRLRLFRGICDAVNYAHQRGVIHRDLKPSNIVVLEASGADREQIKILDFGLARITEGDDTERTMLSEPGMIKGTLPYMSPEQARGDRDAVDLRTDVYSLGVILHKMLAANMPYDVESLSVFEGVRVICEQAPRSVREASSGAMRLDEDVATIVRKALEKEPQRRYQSAAAFSEDIVRYLGSQPILARPPSTVYQIRKLVARHRAPFALAALLGVLVVAFGVWMSVLYTRADRNLSRALQAETEAARETATAEQVSEFLVGLFSVSDPGESRGNTITAREILDEGAASVRDELSDQPGVQATLMNTMGRVYLGLGLYEQAERQLQWALEKREELLGEEHPLVATTLNEIAMLRERQGEYAQAEPLLERSIAITERTLGENSPELAVSLGNLAMLYWNQGRYDDAEPLFQRALRILEANFGPESPEVATPINNLAVLYWNLARYEEAESLMRRALSIWERELGADHPDVATALNNLAMLLQGQKRYTEAEPLARRALAIREKAFGPDHLSVGQGLHNLAELCRFQGRDKEAERLYRRALTVLEAAVGADHPETATAMHNLGELYRGAGRLDEAEPLLERALAIRQSALGPEHPHVAFSLNSLAAISAARGRLGEAEARYRRALAIREAALGPDHPRVADTLEALAEVLRRTGREAEADELAERLAAIRDRGDSG